jgi:hypothetical protein
MPPNHTENHRTMFGFFQSSGKMFLRSEWGAGAGTTVRPFVEEGCTTEEEI